MRAKSDSAVRFLLPSLCVLVILVSACSSGPRPPAKGTDAWYWQTALDTYAAGDYLKTVENVEPAAEPDSELAAQAMPFQLVLTAGIASGYLDVADAFETGAKENEAGSVAFIRSMNQYRSLAEKMIIKFAETAMAYQKLGGAGSVPLAFSFPPGDTSTIPELAKAEQGIALSPNETTSAVRRALEQGVLRAASNAVGGGEDTAAAQRSFSGENPSVPRDVFVLGNAKQLSEFSRLYADFKLNRPDRMKQLAEIALGLAQSVPESEDSKALAGDIQKDIAVAEDYMK